MPKTETGINHVTMLGGIESAKAVKLSEINSKCELALRSLTDNYPDTERLTFDQQKAEAASYQANNTASCPMLTTLAQARGITIEDLAARVLEKAAAFSKASGALIGTRQKFEDTLDGCTNIQAVESIFVDYAL